MMYRIYLRQHGGGRIDPTTKTQTTDPVAAEAAYRSLLARDDLIGEPVAAVLSSSLPGSGGGSSIYFSRFDSDLGTGRIHPDAPLDLLRTDDGTGEATSWTPELTRAAAGKKPINWLRAAGLTGREAAVILSQSDRWISSQVSGAAPPGGGLLLLRYLWPLLGPDVRAALLRGDHLADPRPQNK